VGLTIGDKLKKKSLSEEEDSSSSLPLPKRQKGGHTGSVDYIICLTKPTKDLFDSLAKVLKPFGTICLVVAGESIKSLDMRFVFFKSGSVCTETVFSSCSAGFYLDQGDQITRILELITEKKDY